MIRSKLDAGFTDALDTFARKKHGEHWTFEPLLKTDPEWWPKAKARIHECDAVLWVVSAGSVRSVPCRGEAQYALRIRRPLMLWCMEPVHVPGFAVGYALRVASPDTAMEKGLRLLHDVLCREPHVTTRGPARSSP